MANWYILDESHTVLEVDHTTWKIFWSDKPRRDVATTAFGEYRVSTRFLEHGVLASDDSLPVLFETVVLRKKVSDRPAPSGILFFAALRGWRERCSTWNEAVEQHQAMCTKVCLQLETGGTIDHLFDPEPEID